jgi:putative intracellular protease/amidase
MKWRTLLLAAILVFSLPLSNPPVVSSLDIPDTSDVKILMLISDYFGWNYFDARQIFESWGINVTTVAYSLDHEVTSCPNRNTGENESVIVEYTMQEMTPEMVAEFDCLFIPAGGHWANLIAGNTSLTFISDAYNLGLIVASVCIGTRVVSEANNIVNGSKVVYYPMSSIQMTQAGAITILGLEVISDGRIITGGSGGGITEGGYLEAPTSEVCAEVVRQAFGWSRVANSSLLPDRGFVGTSFTITVGIDNLNDTLGDILSTEIHGVTAQVYGFGNRTLVDTIELRDDDQDGNYIGYFIGQENGEYVVDIEVEDSNETLEVVREIGSFNVGAKPIDIVLVYTITGGSAIIVVLIVALIKKK